MDTDLSSPPVPSAVLVRALRTALRPLVRLMLASGITFPFVAELLKSLFVEIAERDFRLQSRSMSDSRVHLLTGVHRKDVRRLREPDRDADEIVPETVSFGGRLVATWLSDERFLDGDGNPRPLLVGRTGDGQPGFEDLVASQTTDIGPRVVLDEWLRLGIVRVDGDGRCVLNTDAFVPQAGLEEKLFFFAHNLNAHAAAATDNLLGKQAAQLERSLIYEGLTQASMETVERRARRLGMKMLQDLNRLAIEQERGEAHSTAPRGRFTCGLYFHREPGQQASSQPPGRADAEQTDH